MICTRTGSPRRGRLAASCAAAGGRPSRRAVGARVRGYHLREYNVTRTGMMSNSVNSGVLTRIDIRMHGKKKDMPIPVNSGALTLIDMHARRARAHGAEAGTASSAGGSASTGRVLDWARSAFCRARELTSAFFYHARKCQYASIDSRIDRI